MANTPNSSYWGTPPQTPTPHSSSSSSQNAPQPPIQNPPYPYQTPLSSESSPFQQTEGYPPYPTPPTPQQPKKKRGCLIAAIIGIFLVLVLGIGGCSALLFAVSDSIQEHEDTSLQNIPIPEPNDPDAFSDDASTFASNTYFRDLFALGGSGSISKDDLNTVQKQFFGDNSKKPNKKGEYAEGIYFVGSDIPAGSYYFSGSNTDLSCFFILQPKDDQPDQYNVMHINNYYGHNIMEVKEGEVLLFINGATILSLDSFAETYQAPYQSGMYRVGIDIPAGTYRLSLGEADDYSACYIMKDLNFTDASYLAEYYYIPGDEPEEITLEEGTYVELYNMSMMPNIA